MEPLYIRRQVAQPSPLVEEAAILLMLSKR